MKLAKLISAPLLMILSIVCITVFQLYWLVQNYGREKKAMLLKSEAAFRETIMQLQVARLKLDGLHWNGKDSTHANVNIVMKTDEQVEEGFEPKSGMLTSINIIRNKLRSSLATGKDSNKVISFTMDKTFSSNGKDSSMLNRTMVNSSTADNRIFQLLYGVDSLQDSLRLSEIDSAFAKALKKEKLSIPFSISKTDSASPVKNHLSNEVLVGFANPVSYKMVPGNTVPFLIRQIIQPIIFSILLLGITIIAFVVLYKNLAKQKRLAEEKNEFISNITHELKTPIATVGVAIEALKNFNAMDDPQRTREYLDISQNELQRLGLLVDKVLKLSMFENREVELKHELVNLESLVNEVVVSLKLQLEKYKAMVTVTHTGDVTITGDRMHLLSVIFNLVDNALKYNSQAPLVQVDIRELNNSVVLTIADNGIGIAADYQHKVFDKFFRIPHGDTHNAKGYGLGLSYVAQVIQKHKGAIEMESQPGKGTTFTITLPKQIVSA